MQKTLIALAGILFCLCADDFAQTTGGALPKVSENAAHSGFSESVEYTPREITTVRREKPKKEKKKKKDEQAKVQQSPVNTGGTNEIEDGATVKDELITVPASVLDRSGKSILDLKKSDFEIFVDGKRQEISGFATKVEPINVVLMIDVSPSTAYNIEEIQNCALSIVEQLKPEDKVLVIQFSEATKILAELTDDRQAIYKAIRATKFGEGTSLYGAVKSTFEKRVNFIQGRKAVVLLSDGVDTTSVSANYESSLLAAEKSDAAVFPVYFDTFADNTKIKSVGNGAILGSILNQPIILGGSPISLKEEYELGRNYLDDIALLSGGRALAIQKPKSKGKISVDNVGAEIRLQYLLSFRASDAAKMGDRRRIKVRVNRADLLVRARGSYIVKMND